MTVESDVHPLDLLSPTSASYRVRRLSDGSVKAVPGVPPLDAVRGTDLGEVVNACAVNIHALGTVGGAVYQGGSIYITPATYVYATGIDLRPSGTINEAHILLEGGGMRGTKLNFTGTGSAVKCHGDGSATDKQARVAIRDLSVEGVTSGEGSIGIDIKTVERHLSLESLYVLNFDADGTTQKTGIKLQDCLSGHATQVFIEECTNGLHILGDDTPNEPNNGCNFYNLNVLRARNDTPDAGRGIWIQGKNAGLNFYGGTVQEGHEAEIYIDPDTGADFSGDIQNIGFIGMWLETTTAPSTGHAVHVATSGSSAVRGLKFRDMTFAGNDYETGIYLDGADDTLIEGVLFRDFDGQVGGVDQKPVETTSTTKRTRIRAYAAQNTPMKPFSLGGTGETINGLGQDAAGVLGSPTASEWRIGDRVHNTDDDTFWVLDHGGTFRKIA